MNWILEHLQLVIALAGGFAFWLKQRSEAKAVKDQPAQPARPTTMAEGDDADRARKIREEIMRKIAERRGGAGATPAAKQSEEKKFQLPPLVRPVAPLDSFGGPARPVIRRSAPVAQPPAMAKGESDEAVLMRQERLAQQMRELEAQRAVTLKRATVAAEATRVADGISARAASAVRQDLREPRSVRHAVILREVLGTPVGLR